MFSNASKVLSEGLGAADNCSVFFGAAGVQSKSEFLQFLQPDEVPQILLKSIKGEFIFTDCALTYVFGEAAAGKKREIRRLDYRENPVKDISFETAGMGMSDNDANIIVKIGNTNFNMEIKKSEQDNGIKVFRILHSLAIVQEAESRYFQLATSAFTGALGSSLSSDPAAASNLITVAMQGAEAISNRYNRRSYRDIFDMHIQH